MKVAVIGYSGSGKSTLAKKLGRIYQCPVLHLDRINFEPGWRERDPEDARRTVSGFLDENGENGWIIDGNYSGLCQERRLKEADLIVFVDFPRRICLWQAMRRYVMYRGRVRDSIADGCEEKMDLPFLMWILRNGRSRKYKNRYREIQECYPEKTLVIRNHKEMSDSLIRLAPRSRLKAWK